VHGLRWLQSADLQGLGRGKAGHGGKRRSWSCGGFGAFGVLTYPIRAPMLVFLVLHDSSLATERNC